MKNYLNYTSTKDRSVQDGSYSLTADPQASEESNTLESQNHGNCKNGGGILQGSSALNAAFGCI